MNGWCGQDSVAGTTLIDQIATHHPSIRTTWVDGGYRQHLVEHAATRGIDMQIVQRDPRTSGFTPLPRRWVVERTLCAARRSVVSPVEPGGTWREVSGLNG